MTPTQTRYGIAGIHGRMGHLIATLAPTQTTGIGRDGNLATLAQNTDVVLDFTHPSCSARHAATLAAAATPWVLGTTGIDPTTQHAIADAATRIAIVQAANFSPGITLLIALAERLGATLPISYDAEILETHHRQKRDAPSGTALALAQAVATGRATPRADIPPNRAGPRADGAIGIAVLRAGQIIGEHSLSFTSAEEQITLSHRAFDRAVFAAGALRAADWIIGQPPGLYGMNHVLGL